MLFLGTIHWQNHKIVRDSVRKLAYDVAKRNYFWHVVSHTHTFNSPFSGTTKVSRYQKGKTDLDFTEARDSEWQWHQLGHMQVCTSLQTDNHASTPPLWHVVSHCRNLIDQLILQ